VSLDKERAVKASLFYFSGTGNSLYVARRIAEALGGPEAAPIAREVKKAAIRVESETVGIVTPLYFAGWPAMVRDFLERADFPAAEYVFLVYTAGEPFLESITGQVSRAMKRKGLRLDASFGIKMVDSYILKFKAEPESPKMSDDIERRLSRVVSAVRERKPSFHARLPVPPRLVSEPWLAKAPALDRSFAAGESCNGCGTCLRVCPAANIALAEGKPIWDHRCQFCLACLHACPRSSIECGEGTKGKVRYRNSHVSLGDLLLSR
jgi:ferredoxin